MPRLDLALLKPFKTNILLPQAHTDMAYRSPCGAHYPRETPFGVRGQEGLGVDGT